MPTSVFPVIRFHQEAAESNGLYQSLNSVLVTEFLAEELAGTRIKQVPKQFIVLRGTKYTAS